MQRSTPITPITPGKPRIPEETRTPSGLKLPHERDESAQAVNPKDGPRDVMRQALKDVAEGQEDTDCHGPDRPNKPHCSKG